MNHDTFTQFIQQQGEVYFRAMPWRDDTQPYFVLVSELMLQQTQVARVIPKFQSFVTHFPTIADLAVAPLSDVVGEWQGLGYNRRAKYLHAAAQRIVEVHHGIFPQDHPSLLALPGVGVNTAGAIAAYAFNQPALFIETNIRTVFLHHFFPLQERVDDAEIMSLLKATLDQNYPRKFYWALMDYGSYLKANGVKNIRQSRHYKKQPRLEGSVRQVRGAILTELVRHKVVSLEALKAAVNADDRFTAAFEGLRKDGLISVSQDQARLTN